MNDEPSYTSPKLLNSVPAMGRHPGNDIVDLALYGDDPEYRAWIDAKAGRVPEQAQGAAPRLLDLFCGAGGAAMGYHRAGFDVVGVDINPQPHYPFEFIQADALTFPLGRRDAIHASPPCQDHIRGGMHPVHGTGWMLSTIRNRLNASRLPWVIENVPGAPMRADLRLCGCMFDLEVRRERWFETSWHAFDLRPPCHHPEPPVGVYGHPRGGKPGKTWGWGTYEDWVRAMGIDWMTADELAQAIPPAYTEHIGRMLLAELAVAP